MAGGRPTTYDPAYCEQVIAMGAYGASKAEMSLELGIARSTFQLWEQDIPEFSVAVSTAMDLSQGWWEKKGRIATFESQGFNPTSYVFNMKNRFKQDWSDKQVTEHTGDAFAGLMDLLKPSEGLPDE